MLIPVEANCDSAESSVVIDVDGAPVSDANPFPVDVVAGSISIDPGDIEIGAVEIKSAGNDNRAEVDLPANLTGADLVLGVHDPALPVSLGQKTGAGSTSVVLASDQGSVPVAGDVASGVANSGNPLQNGGRASTTPPTAVGTGQRVGALASVYGEMIARGVLPEAIVTQTTTISASTAETTIGTADATYKLFLWGILFTNISAATYTKVQVRDSTAGTVRETYSVPAQDSRGWSHPVPFPQAAVNNNWTAQCGTSTTDILVTALFEKRLT